MNPFERDKHLINEHDADETTVDSLDADDARQLHRLLHSHEHSSGRHKHDDGAL